MTAELAALKARVAAGERELARRVSEGETVEEEARELGAVADTLLAQAEEEHEAREELQAQVRPGPEAEPSIAAIANCGELLAPA